MNSLFYRSGLTLFVFCLLAAGNAFGQDEPAFPPKVPTPAPTPLNVERLLANPIFSREEFRYLYLRRRWLAQQGGRIEAFEAVAAEFAEKGAIFSAVEILWFAEKMTSDPAKKAQYQGLMRQWQVSAGETDRLVQEALQFSQAGRREEAADKLLQAIKLNPYSEQAHYQFARLHVQMYQDGAAESDKLMPLVARERVFRLAYEALLYTIAIDPLYYDGYLMLSNLRELFPDQDAVLAETQSFTERALRFKSGVIPPLEKIEGGQAEIKDYEEFAEALDSAGVLDYAVYAYQTALHRGSAKPEMQPRLDAIIAKYFADAPPAQTAPAPQAAPAPQPQ